MQQIEALHEALKRSLRLDKQPLAFAGKFVKTLGSSAALRCGITVAGLQHAFLLEPIERRVEGSGSDLASGAKRDLAANTYAVGFVTKANNSEKNRLFEFTECMLHILTIL